MATGALILSCRLQRGLTQAELAARAGMTPANLSAVEAGRRDLLVGTLLRIAAALDRPPADLVPAGPAAERPLTHDTLNAVAASVLTGRRPFSAALNSLADGVAWTCRPILEAVRAPGARRGTRRAARLAQLSWSREQVERLTNRVRKLAASDAPPTP